MTMHVAELWRYPVKSLAGESLSAVDVTPDGIPGDRVVHVRGPEGLRTSRRHHRLLGLRGTLDDQGKALINGLPWNTDEALRLVQAAAGSDAWLVAYAGVERFDVLPLLVTTDGAVAEFGRDVRRLRPNIVIAGAPGRTERSWVGHSLQVGGALIEMDSLRARCPMTTVDPETLERDPEVLRDIGRRFGGRLALNARVVVPGLVRLGDPVSLTT